MKYIKLLLILILVLPLFVLAEECDMSKITITSVAQKSIEGNTKVISEPTFKDRNINLDLKMYEVGDSVTYDMIIKNESEEDYMIDENTFKTDSDYIEYTLKTNDDSNVVKAKSSKDLTLTVEYKKEVDSSLLNNNKFNASNSLKISLNTSEKEKVLDVITTDNIKESLAPQEVKNPITSVSNMLLVIFVLLTAIIGVFILIRYKNKCAKYILIVLSMFIIPIVYAICKCDIEVESTIEIEKLPKLYDTVVQLSSEDNACVTKYDGEVTDQVGQTVQAHNVYFNKCADKRNVVFGGFCWQVIRTTETKGTKMIYNGEPVDGKCESTRGNHKGIVGSDGLSQKLNASYLYGDSFTYDTTNNTFTLTNPETAIWSDSSYADLIGKYTCKNSTGTCTTLYNINGYDSNTSAYTSGYTIGNTNYAQIGKSPFNANYGSPAMVGYMFNKVYNYKSGAPTSGSLMGNDVSYSNGTYTLLPADGESTLGTTKDATHHYTCNNTTGTCNKVRYYYYSSGSLNYYIELDGAENIQTAVNEMLYNDNVNTYNSSIKGIVDSWYAQNLSSKTNMLEDTVYCNARNMTNQATNGWNKDVSLSTYMYFKNETLNNDLSCINETDQFAVGNSKAKLTYPVALLEEEEYNINTSSLMSTGAIWWGLSPHYFNVGSAFVRYVYSAGGISYDYVGYASGVRLVVSLKNGITFSRGTGSETDPWVIE